jgi:hypothetical protein
LRVQVAEPVFLRFTMSVPSAIPPELLKASSEVWQVPVPVPEASPEEPPALASDPAVPAPLPVDALLPPESWEPELCEPELWEEEPSDPAEESSPLWQAVSERPAATATARRDNFWTRMGVPFRVCPLTRPERAVLITC